MGESGCGKSITALAVMGLLRRPLSLGRRQDRARRRRRSRTRRAAEMRRLRGKRIAMIFQEPMTALNPLSPVGRQIAEMFVLHEGVGWNEAMDRAEEALRQVRVPSPERRIRDYPHQLSGGMRQRVMIAIALACGPDLLVADEPTTALDVTVQAEIIDLMAELCAAKGTAILMISHDLGLVANMCRRVAVMYAGRIVEAQAGRGDLRHAARIPIRRAWSIRCRGSASARGAAASVCAKFRASCRRSRPIPAGCRFNPRCPAATEICRDGGARRSRPCRRTDSCGAITMAEAAAHARRSRRALHGRQRACRAASRP